MSDKKNSTSNERISDIELNRAIHILKHFENKFDFTSDFVIYACGNTFKGKQAITNIEKKMSEEVIINESWRKGLFRLLPVPMPRFFLIKITNQKNILQIFHALNDYLFIEFAIFHKDIELDFLNNLKFVEKTSVFDFIKSHEQHIIYGVDCDNGTSNTGIMEFTSYGNDAPTELIPFL